MKIDFIESHNITRKIITNFYRDQYGKLCSYEFYDSSDRILYHQEILLIELLLVLLQIMLDRTTSSLIIIQDELSIQLKNCR